MRKMLLLMLLLADSLSAAEEARHDMRELCRSEVSGTLLSAYNDVDYLRGLIAQSEQKVKDAKAKQLLLDARYQNLIKDHKPAVPALDMDEKVLALQFELVTLRDQIREGQKHIAENRQQLNQREDFRKQFEAMVKPVFHVVRRKDSPPGAYDFRLEYKHACGPYELLCPMPREHAAQLRIIAGKLARPEWCERYSQLMPP